MIIARNITENWTDDNSLRIISSKLSDIKLYIRLYILSNKKENDLFLASQAGAKSISASGR